MSPEKEVYRYAMVTEVLQAGVVVMSESDAPGMVETGRGSGQQDGEQDRERYDGPGDEVSGGCTPRTSAE